jgi:hypothetical protein
MTRKIKEKSRDNKPHRNVFMDLEDSRFSIEHKVAVDNFILNYNFKADSFAEKSIIKLSELNCILDALKADSAPSEDGIHNKMLINSSFSFRKILLNFVNKSINASYLPTKCKQAVITMIPKKGRSDNPKDYRPISLTSSIAKLCEKAVVHRFKAHLAEKKVILKQQSGFRTHRQTKDNLFFLIQKIIESFNRQKSVCAIFFDIAAAFDKVWHNGLIFKLIQADFPVFITAWIKNFLENHFALK